MCFLYFLLLIILFSINYCCSSIASFYLLLFLHKLAISPFKKFQTTFYDQETKMPVVPAPLLSLSVHSEEEQEKGMRRGCCGDLGERRSTDVPVDEND